MALDVINEIKAAEEKALGTRRVASVAAKDAIKLAAEENREIFDKELSVILQSAAQTVETAENAARTELEALSEQRGKECAELKNRAEKNLARAADACLERILH
jgi:isoaspartyl peptidase/L-asparaginase-like protein (Ntn-hydrolase superfamily)